MIRQGKILYWGTSVWEAEQLATAHKICAENGWTHPIVEQPRYNLIDRHVEDSIQSTAIENGMGLVPWSPLQQGLLTGKYNSGIPTNSRAATSKWVDQWLTDENLESCRNLTLLAAEAGVAPEQLALAWLLSRDGVSSAITGATSPEQVLSNCRSLEVEVTEDLIDQIEACFGSGEPLK